MATTSGVHPDEIPWSATRAPEPPAPPLSQLLGSGADRTAALRYHVGDRVFGLAKTGLIGLSRTLPPAFVSGLGAGALAPLAAAHYRGGPMVHRMERAIAHLEPSLADDPAGRQALLSRWFANTARAMLELGALERICAEPRMRFAGLDRLKALRREGQRMVIVTVHTGTWEAIAYVASRHAPMTAPFQPQRNRFENRIVARVRQRYGVRTLPPSPGLARTLLKVLSVPGQAIVVLIDELSDNAIKFPLFGRSVPTRGNLRFALRAAQTTGAALVPVTISRTGGVDHVFEVHPPLAAGAGEVGVGEAAHALNALYEPFVHARLDQWYMLHNYKV